MNLDQKLKQLDKAKGLLTVANSDTYEAGSILEEILGIKNGTRFGEIRNAIEERIKVVEDTAKSLRITESEHA